MRFLIPACAVSLLCCGLSQAWTIQGGNTTLQLNYGLLSDMGLYVDVAEDAMVSPYSSLALAPVGGDFEDRLTGGIRHYNSIMVSDGRQEIVATDFMLEAASPKANFALRDDDGEVLFYLSNVHARYAPGEKRIWLMNMDVRVSPELARRLGRPGWADLGVGAAHVVLFIEPDMKRGDFSVEIACTNNFGPFTDVTLTGLSNVQQVARQTNVRVALSMAVTLKNVGATGVPWYWAIAPTGFAGPLIGQHPYLVMHIYRIADGIVRQLGKSDVKHAFYATNTDCPCDGGQVLHVGCSDTYSMANNTNQFFFGPREEVAVHSGQWTSLGSHFDGVPVDNIRSHSNHTDAFTHMLTVVESDLQATGAQYYVEAWYIVAGDTNIFNNTGYRRVTPTLTNNVWTFPVVGTNLNLGGAINAWPAQTSSVLKTTEGHLQLAAATTNLGSGRYRYSYALMNYDFDRALRAFSVPVSDALSVSNILFVDADTNSLNDWQATIASNAITWRMPTNPSPNPLLWGTLFSFRFEADAPPVDAMARLDIYGPGTSSTLNITTKGALLPEADLGIAVSAAPAMAVLGQDLVFTIVATNAGPSLATNITIGGSLLTEGPLALAPGESTQWLISVTFTNTEPIPALTNEFSISGWITDPETNNNHVLLVTLTDHDGDGMPTWAEDDSGDGLAYLDANRTFDVVAGGEQPGVALRSISGAVYQMRFTTNLAPPQTWFDLGGAVTADGPWVAILDTNATETQKYYRVLLDRLP